MIENGSLARVAGIHSIALRVPNFDVTAAFYRDVWLMTDSGGDGGHRAFRTAGSDHDDLLLGSGEAGIEHISFCVAGHDELQRLGSQLKGAEIEPRALTDAELMQGEAAGLVVVDADGRKIRLVVPEQSASAPASQDNVLAPRSIGHVVLWTPDVARAEAFYGLLGFSVSDRTHLGMTFLRCANEDHHSLALIGSDTGRTGLQHLAFDVGPLDNVMRNFARLRDLGVPIAWGVGRHGPGNNVFSYYQDPAGNFLEYYGDMEKIPVDDVLEPKFWGPEHKGDIWGVAGMPPEAFRK